MKQAGILAILMCPLFASAQDPSEKAEKTIGRVTIGSQRAQLDSGDIYQLTIEGKGFTPTASANIRELRVIPIPGDKRTTQEWVLVPATSKVHRLFIFPQIDDQLPDGPLEFELSIKKMPLKTPLIKFDAALQTNDPVYAGKSPHRAFPVVLKKGRFYVIDMVAKDKSLDPLLYLEGPRDGTNPRKIAAVDDDGGGDVNARIVYAPIVEGEHVIVATSIGKSTGGFTLTVREQK